MNVNYRKRTQWCKIRNLFIKIFRLVHKNNIGKMFTYLIFTFYKSQVTISVLNSCLECLIPRSVSKMDRSFQVYRLPVTVYIFIIDGTEVKNMTEWFLCKLQASPVCGRCDKDRYHTVLTVSDCPSLLRTLFKERVHVLIVSPTLNMGVII